MHWLRVSGTLDELKFAKGNRMIDKIKVEVSAGTPLEYAALEVLVVARKINKSVVLSLNGVEVKVDTGDVVHGIVEEYKLARGRYSKVF